MKKVLEKMGLTGDVSDLRGDVDLAGLTTADRLRGVDISDLTRKRRPIGAS